MTDKIHKLTDNVDEFFKFDIDGKIYKMRYPTGEERKKMADIGQKASKSLNEAEKAQQEGNEPEFDVKTKEAAKNADELSAFLETLVTPEDPKSPSLNEALQDKPTPVLRNFQQMLQSELSIEAPNVRR